MTWRLIIIAVLIVLLIPTMALLRKQEAAKKTGDKEQIAAVQNSSMFSAVCSSRCLCVCWLSRCSMCILRNFRKKQKFFAKNA